MELIKSVRKRGLVAKSLHVVFNIAYVAALFASVYFFPGTPWAAFFLVFVSKWRIFAVRPRYWFANLLSNLTDLLLGIGVALLMWQNGDSLVLQIILAALYAVWLILVKPMHKHTWILIQAGTAQFVALTALFSVAHMIPLPIVVLMCFLIGFVVARHILDAHREDSRTLLAMVWGLIVAELGFVAYHWTIAYQIYGSLQIPQIAIIIAVMAFVVERAYDSLRKHGFVRWSDLRWPVIFASTLIAMLLILFSGLNSASQL